MTSLFPEPDTELGSRVARRLDESVAAWLTVVDAAGTPQPAPIWFLWDGESALIYSRGDAKRLAHLRAHPRVSLNLDSDEGGNIVVLTGEVHVVDEPPAYENPAYLEKYGERITKGWQTAENFAAQYSVPLRFRPTRFRGY